MSFLNKFFNTYKHWEKNSCACAYIKYHKPKQAQTALDIVANSCCVYYYALLYFAMCACIF